jgi:hypothetical protein
MLLMMTTMIIMTMLLMNLKVEKMKIKTPLTMKRTNLYLPSNHGPRIEPRPAREYNHESFNKSGGPATCLFLAKARATSASTS